MKGYLQAVLGGRLARRALERPEESALVAHFDTIHLRVSLPSTLSPAPTSFSKHASTIAPNASTTPFFASSASTWSRSTSTHTSSSPPPLTPSSAVAMSSEQNCFFSAWIFSSTRKYRSWLPSCGALSSSFASSYCSQMCWKNAESTSPEDTSLDDA